MLQSQFFVPCDTHAHLKKNEVGLGFCVPVGRGPNSGDINNWARQSMACCVSTENHRPKIYCPPVHVSSQCTFFCASCATRPQQQQSMCQHCMHEHGGHQTIQVRPDLLILLRSHARHTSVLSLRFMPYTSRQCDPGSSIRLLRRCEDDRHQRVRRHRWHSGAYPSPL